MPQIEEVFDDFKETVGDGVEGVKKFIKEKPFLALCFVVGGVALVYGLTRDRSTTASVDEYIVPTSYAGYPTIGGSGSVDDGSFGDSGVYDEMQNIYDQMASYGEQYDSTMASLNDQFVSLSERVEDYQTLVDAQQAELERQEALARMKRNTDMYSYVDAATKRQLREANQAIGAQLGLSFNEKTGNWYNSDGSIAYLAAWQEAQAGGKTSTTPAASGGYANRDIQAEINAARNAGLSSTKVNSLVIERANKISSGGGSATSYDRNTDYAAAIAQAKKTGASKSVISTLEKQREAKIKGENLNSNGTKKK